MIISIEDGNNFTWFIAVKDSGIMFLYVAIVSVIIMIHMTGFSENWRNHFLSPSITDLSVSTEYRPRRTS